MSIVAPAPRSASSFVPCPEGLHQAVCVDVIDLGIVPSAFGEKPKIRIVWQVAATHNGRRFDVRKLYTLSLHKKSALRKDLEAWRGRKFADAEILNGFNVEKLLGANCQIQVQHDAGDDGIVWANVTAIVPVPAGVPKLVAVGYTRQRERERASA